MSLWHFFLYLVLAGLAGSLGQAIAGYSRTGCLGSVALGFIGAVLGSWLANSLGFPSLLVISIDHQPFPLVWATLGAALFVAFLGLIAGARTRRRPPST